MVADTVWGVAVVGLVVFTVWRIVVVLGRQRRHHRRANKRFMQGYRAGFQAARSHDCRTTVEAAVSSRPRLPVVRPRRPTDAGDPRPLASAGPGSTARRHRP